MQIDFIFILQILICFMAYSFAGWVLESILKTCLQKKFVNSGFLHGPVCPIYGAGAMIMLVFLSGFKDSIIILFFASFFVLSIWEYMVGVFLEKMFQTKYWDYSENRFNINGRVCLLNSFYWGILGVLFIRYIHPFIFQEVSMLSKNMLIYINILLYSYFIVDTITSIVKVKNFAVNLDKVNKLKDTIKEKIEELKEIGENTRKQEYGIYSKNDRRLKV